MCIRDRCHLPPDAGNCGKVRSRWYYDTSLRSCRPFNYGCCGGNANNFKTKRLCEDICSEDVCKLCVFQFYVNTLSYAILVLKNHQVSLFFFLKMFGYFLYTVEHILVKYRVSGYSHFLFCPRIISSSCVLHDFRFL